jgi:hypothetical protein
MRALLLFGLTVILTLLGYFAGLLVIVHLAS